MVKIMCEIFDCGRILGEGADHDEAHEDAIYANGYEYDPEAGVYVCDDCAAAEMQYLMAGFGAWQREQEQRQLAEDHDNYVNNVQMMLDRVQADG